ncbi:MAG: hypothetical protein WBG90_04870 [Saonia sp.]
MKVLKIAMGFFVLLVFFVSCDVSSDDNSAPIPNFDVLGLYDLVEVNVSSAQDLNEDGTASSNILDELDCASGTLLIDGDLVWTFNQINLNATPITGDQFAIDCSTDTTSVTGTWFSDATTVTFDGDPALSTLRIDGDRLINDIGEELPGFQSFVYERRIVN